MSKRDSKLLSLSETPAARDSSLLSQTLVHDLNNILTGILGHVSFLNLSPEADPERSSSLAAIESATRRAAELTTQILKVSEAAPPQLEPVDLCEIARETAEIIGKNISEREIRLHEKNLQQPVFVSADSGQLHQLLLNLLVNAADAIGSAGVIELGVYRLSAERAADISQDDYPKNLREMGKVEDLVCLSVQDSGCGIPEEVQKKIFDPFFSTKGSAGNGLGLAAVRAIAAAHGAHLELESKPGTGTIFRLFFPAAQSPSDSDRDAEKAAQQLSQGSPSEVASEVASGVAEVATESSSTKFSEELAPKELILVVDDEESIRTVLQRSLEHFGYEVLVAESGAEGLAVFEKNSEQISLVILDMIMPGMAGDELFFEMKKIRDTVPALIASGYASKPRTDAILSAGGLGYLKKPFAVDELVAEVRRCIEVSVD